MGRGRDAAGGAVIHEDRSDAGGDALRGAARRAGFRIPMAMRAPFMLWRVRFPAPMIPDSIRVSRPPKYASSRPASWSASCP